MVDWLISAENLQDNSLSFFLKIILLCLTSLSLLCWLERPELKRLVEVTKQRNAKQVNKKSESYTTTPLSDS